jgi:hypothetical protein
MYAKEEVELRSETKRGAKERASFNKDRAIPFPPPLHTSIHPSIHPPRKTTREKRNITMGSVPTEIAALKAPFGHVINGKLVTKSEKTLDVINPSTEEVIASVPVATQATLDETVDAARKAFKTWSKTTWQDRAERIRAWGKTFKDDTPELAKLLTSEQGKSIGVSMYEVRPDLGVVCLAPPRLTHFYSPSFSPSPRAPVLTL